MDRKSIVNSEYAGCPSASGKVYLLYLLLSVFLVSLVLVPSRPVSARTISVQLKTRSRTVGLDQPFYVQVRVKGLDDVAGDFQLNHSPIFEVEEGGISQQNSVQIINGDVQKAFSFGRNFVCRAKKPGSYTLGPGVFQYRGQRYQTKQIRITVRKDKVGASGRSPFSSFFRDPFHRRSRRSRTQKTEKVTFFARYHIEPVQAYVNQEQRLYIDLFFSQPVLRKYQTPRQPKQGFWEQKVEVDAVPGPEKVEQKGKEWYRYRIWVSALYSTAPGMKTIPDTEIVFLYGRRRIRKDRLMIAAQKVRVRPLPLQGQPNDFDGNIGRFRMSSQCSAESVRVGEPFELQVTVSGQGNIQSIPSLNRAYNSSVFRILEPDVRFFPYDETDNNALRKVFTYTVYPKKTGRFRLPVMSLVYFDAAGKQYKKLTSKKTDIRILPGLTSSEEKENEVDEKKKIFFYAPGQKTPGGLLPISFGLLVTVYLILALGAGFLFLRRRQEYIYSSNPVLGRRNKAYREALKLLQEASRQVGQDKTMAVGQVEKALRRYIAGQSGHFGENYTIQEFHAFFEEMSLPEARFEQFSQMLMDLSKERFGKSNALSLEKQIEKAKSFIHKLRKEIRDYRKTV